MSLLKLKLISTPYTYILEWTNLGKRYIGARWSKDCHPSDLWKKYFTSSNFVHEFVEKNGPPDIILIDKICASAEEAQRREQFLLRKFDVINNKDFLNKSVGGWYDYSDPEILKKRYEKLKGQKRTPEQCARISANHGLRGIAPHNKGKKLSEEWKNNLRISHLGNKASRETKDKISKSCIFRKLNKIIVTCPHCQKQGQKFAMHRWHFNNCRSLKE